MKPASNRRSAKLEATRGIGSGADVAVGRDATVYYCIIKAYHHFLWPVRPGGGNPPTSCPFPLLPSRNDFSLIPNLNHTKYP
jgi:hypothetical protein